MRTPWIPRACAANRPTSNPRRTCEGRRTGTGRSARGWVTSRCTSSRRRRRLRATKTRSTIYTVAVRGGSPRPDRTPARRSSPTSTPMTRCAATPVSARAARKITFTRTRPGNSNDGAHVEQKNWAGVRTVSRDCGHVDGNVIVVRFTTRASASSGWRTPSVRSAGPSGDGAQRGLGIQQYPDRSRRHRHQLRVGGGDLMHADGLEQVGDVHAQLRIDKRVVAAQLSARDLRRRRHAAAPQARPRASRRSW